MTTGDQIPEERRYRGAPPTAEQIAKDNYRGLGPDGHWIGLDRDGFPYTPDPSMTVPFRDEDFGPDGYPEDVPPTMYRLTLSKGEVDHQTITVPGIGPMNTAQYEDYLTKKQEWLDAGNQPYTPDPTSVHHERTRSKA